MYEVTEGTMGKDTEMFQSALGTAGAEMRTSNGSEC